jgi:hypothetical protein
MKNIKDRTNKIESPTDLSKAIIVTIGGAIITSLVIVNATRNRNNLPKKYYDYRGKLGKDFVYTKNTSYFIKDDEFEICVDHQDKSGLSYLVCYIDKDFNKKLDEIWINGTNYSSNKKVMKTAQKKYEDYLEKMYNKEKEKQAREKETNELINKL